MTASSGCKDDPSGPEVSDETAWRIGCTRREGTCSVAYDRHGGADLASVIKASCRDDEGRLRIELEDPGKDSGGEQPGRNRSVLEITRISVEKNECYVGVFEYDRAASKNELKFVDSCMGNGGTCEITGEMNSNGFDFDGTIFCDGMKLRSSAPDFRLENAAEEAEPVPVQIVNCN